MPQVAIVMPKMSMTMTEGELLAWHVKVGDVINAGDVVCEVATDKIDMEVEATASGTVVSLHGEPGDVMDVGTPLIMVDAESDDLLAGIFDAPPAPPANEAVAEVAVPAASSAPVDVPDAEVAAPVVTNEKVLATPKAKATAQELHVDIARAVPTGTDGVVTTPDVLKLAASASKEERSLEKRLKTRLAIARAIEASSDIPAFSMTFNMKISGRPITDAAQRTVDYAIAWGRALRAFPELHANWNAGAPESFDSVRLAVSVMAAHGVVTPVVEIPVEIAGDFTARLAAIVADAGRGHIALENLKSSTSGFAELGAWPVTAASGILIRPQSTSIAVGLAHVTGDHEYHLPFTITADHRLSDPADVALLATEFARELNR